MFERHELDRADEAEEDDIDARSARAACPADQGEAGDRAPSTAPRSRSAPGRSRGRAAAGVEIGRISSAPRLLKKVSEPEAIGAHAEADLQHQRQQERHAVDADRGRGRRPACRCGSERKPKQREVDGRLLPPGGHAARRPAAAARPRASTPRSRAGGMVGRPTFSMPNCSSARPAPTIRKPREIEARDVCAADVLEIAQRQQRCRRSRTGC